MSVAVLGTAVRTALGDLQQTLAGLAEGRSAFTDTPPYEAEGLTNARCARVEPLDRDRPAEHLLREVVIQALAASKLPAGARIGLVVGTSSGNICGPWERWHQAALAGEPYSEEGTGRDAPTRAVAHALGLAPHATLSVACVSGTAVLPVAEGWLREGLADAVVVAGVDALGRYVHAGFSSLGALSASTPHPFDSQRDGLLLGEGAGALVLAPEGGDVWLVGSAVTSDARHLTAPDRGGRGAIDALLGASTVDVDLVSVHGTGTPFNDAAEVVALEQVFPDRRVAVHGVKHLIGHTLGAAGAIEAAVLVEALRTGRVPPAPQVVDGGGEDPGPRIARFVGTGRAQAGVSLSAAFGGLNAAVCFATSPIPARPVRAARAGPTLRVEAAPDADWGELWPDAPSRVRRLGRFVRVGLLAMSRLVQANGPLPEGTALVLASPTGCREVDLSYHERLLTEGARLVSRVAFTYTVVHAPLAEATLLWGLRGAQLAFVGDVERAEAEARRWVSLQGAPAAVALWIDAPGPDEPARASATLWEPAP